ncbi:MAG: hypothetical protein ACI9LV_000287 [Candidatus Nanohaloarchaea archaeon]|jgi:hypothetical protein
MTDSQEIDDYTVRSILSLAEGDVMINLSGDRNEVMELNSGSAYTCLEEISESYEEGFADTWSFGYREEPGGYFMEMEKQYGKDGKELDVEIRGILEIELEHFPSIK